MLALVAFYSIQQRSSSFLNLTKALQNARNTLSGAGQSWVISDAVLKSHLLFLSHPVLHLRVSGQQSLIYHNEGRHAHRYNVLDSGIACLLKVLSEYFVHP